MNKTLSLTVCFLLAAVSVCFSQTKTKMIDEVIWIVGDEAILKSDVESMIQSSILSKQPIPENPYCVFPEQIAIEKLLLHQAAIDSVTANESYVLQVADYQINEQIANAGGSVQVAESRLGMTIKEAREMLQTRIRKQNIAQMMQSQLMENIEATPAEVRRYFSEMPEDSLPSIPPQVEVQILSLRPPIPNAEITRIKKRLREFTERANKDPKEFALMARLYSEDKGSALRGGEIGFSGRGKLHPEYAAVAFGMQDPNRVSRIVETDYGYHIIQFIERRGDQVNTRHILLKPKVTPDMITKGTKELDSIAEQIRKEKMTFEEAVAKYSDDKNTRMNAGLMMAEDPYTQTVTSKFEYQALPPEVAKVVYNNNMKIGEISDPFVMIDEATGNEMVTIVKLKDKTETHKANIRDDYQLLKIILENKKKQEYFNKWISKKQKETYISIDPAYRDCDFQYKGWIK